MIEGPSNARIGAIERDECVDRLANAFVSGRLDKVEFERRTQAALVAGTETDLWVLVNDINEIQKILPPASNTVIPVAKRDLAKAIAFSMVSAVTCIFVVGGELLGDMYSGLILWLFSLVCGGIGALLAAGGVDRNRR